MMSFFEGASLNLILFPFPVLVSNFVLFPISYQLAIGISGFMKTPEVTGLQVDRLSLGSR
jgi:hypothetical protein